MSNPMAATHPLQQADGDLLFASLPIGIVKLDPAGELMAANPVAASDVKMTAPPY